MMTMMTPGEEIGAGDAHEYAILFWLEIEGAATETIFFDMPVSHSLSLSLDSDLHLFLSFFFSPRTHIQTLDSAINEYIHTYG